jgi:hypothetical protein
MYLGAEGLERSCWYSSEETIESLMFARDDGLVEGGW